VPALQTLVGGLSEEVNAALFIVQHTLPSGPGFLPNILRRATELSVAHALDKEPIATGRIYVAPPDFHLIIAPEQVRLARGPKEHFTRPAIDPLFRSAALAYGPRVIGVILTGTLDDGTAGLWAVKERGGITAVQHPHDAEYPGMPTSALKYVSVNHCLPLVAIAPLIERLVREPSPTHGEYPMPKELELETRIARGEQLSADEVMQLGEPSPFTCPECHGNLTRLKNAGIIRFRCHTGHAYSYQSLLEEVTTDVENNMWSAVRSLEESALLLDHFAKHLEETAEAAEGAAIFRRQSREAEERATVVRQAIMSYERVSPDAAVTGTEQSEARR
jgi:two-component system chemotaxis response regulator CheB